MIDIDASREASALKVYHEFWDSYLKGSIPIFSSTLDENFEMIGTSETEVCHNKAEGIAFFKNQIEEIVGKAEMRNRNIITKAVGEMFLIIENCDIYVISEPEWDFYSKLRISTLLHDTPLGWKVLHQHGSLPDMKVEEGETIALEKVSQENLELRQAVKRRTTELENKTKELEIEAALERVRAVAMSMKKHDDMLDVCQIIADQLNAFGVEQIRNVQTAIIDEEKGHYLCYQYFPAYKKTAIELTEYFKSPVEHEMVRQMLASKDGHFIGSIQEKELREFAAHRKEENHFSDPLLDQSQELSYCFLSIGKGGLGLSLYQALNQEILQIFKRFHQVFTLAYRRFLDIQQAEEQAREAKIEAALERVRSKSLAMHQTSELQSVIHTVHEELLRLNLSIFGGSFIVINSELDTELKCWGAGGTAETSEEIHIPRFDKPFYTNLLERVKKGPSFFTEEFTLEEKVEFFTFLFNHPPWSSLSNKEKKQTLETKGGYTRSCVVSEHTSIFIINHEGVPFSEADNAILKRFGRVFEQSYTRFLDLQKAEAQAREAQIEAALEKVRSRSMGMHNSGELHEVIKVVYEQFRALKIPIEHTGFIMDYKNREDMNIWLADENQVHAQITFPYFDSPHWNSFREAKANGKDFFTNLLDFETKNRFYRKLFSYIPDLPKGTQEFYFSQPGLSISTVLMDNVGLYFENYTTTPFTEEENQILRRFGKVFQQTYTRFLDLQKAEAQAKEARIESALERVRSRSLAMHHSSELSSVVDTLLQEFTGLDFTLTFCIINLIDGDDLSNTVWAANPETGKDAESYYMKFEDYDFHRAMWDAWKAQDKRFVYVLEGEEKKIYDEYLYSETEFRRFPKHVQEANKSLERYVAGFTFFKYSGLQTVSVNPISEEELAILERFGKVFEQAYIRFLDLQKAEAQAREAQIETALEKVRSRSMGMQKSDELADLSLELVKQVQALGVETWFCAFNIYDENGEESIEWGSNGQSTFPRYKTPRENVFLDYYKAGQRGESLLINEISEEECPSHYEYLCSLPGVGDQLLKMKAAGISFPKYQIDHVAFFKYGYILFITYEPVPESHSVFNRFAQVFEQTYTRFLDLQRAEAQTRKSEIEVAVERVRAQSMAMHHPDDLDKVNKELLSQLQWLQIQGLSGVTFYLVEENGWVKAWDFSSPGNIGNQTSYTFQFDSNKHEMLGFPFKILKNTDLDYFIADYPLEKLKRALPELEEIDPSIAEIFTKAIETGALSHQWSACARISSGMLGVDLTAPPSEDTKTIVLKMAGAFNQAYTRFLDLQKAESQAREAQIESALERVRSRSMAMHNSNEIGDVAMVLFQQLKSLGGELWGTGFGFCEKDSEVDEFWFANENGIMPHLKIPNTVDPAHKQMYEGWKKNLDFLSIENGGKELKNHYKYMLTVPDVQPIFQGMLDQGIEFPTWQKWHAAYFKYGYMLVITTETYEDEKVFTRFARVFEQAFTRFLDLQKAEAQAREARIEAALERTRTQSMLMKHSDEIKSISTIFHQQLLELGIPSEFSYVWLPDEPNSEHQFWASWSEEENGKAIYLSKQVTYPLDKSEPYTKACFEAWALPEVLLEEFISPAEVAGFFEVWQELLEGAEKLKAEYFPEGIFYSEAYMRFGCFGINIRRRLTPEEKSILKRFSIEFERAYTRFLDLKKAEEQAREAQIELAVERVRARALAMYHSGEILEVVHKLKEEIMSLNIPQVAAATIHLKEPDGRCRIWDLTSLELKEEDLHLPLDISFKLEDTHPDFFMRKIWAHTGDYFVVIQKKRDFQHTVQWLKDNGHPEQAEEARIFFNTTQLEQAYHPTVPLKNGRMSLDLLEPPQDEVASILKKMAAAFDLAYKRFEDLQKAEAQAKEAQIELSLERIRSKVTSMQESTDLLDIMVSIRSEFVSLGHEAQYFWYMRWLHDKYEKAMTSGDGAQVGMVMTLPRHIHGDIPMVANWERGSEPTLIFPMDIDTAMDYVQKMVSLGDFEKVDPNAPTLDDIKHIGGLTFIMAKTSQGEIGYSLPGYVPNPPEEAVSTLARFAGVFDLAYKRFEDLKKAEKDLVAIKAAKSKAESALKELKAAQEQLIQQEKLASLGQLTAGIAHEIKNPLNFVNNFSELSKELIEEVFEELEKLDKSDIKQEIMDILTDVQSNLTKVHEHGSRADGIVKSMLQHSRGSAGKTSAIRVNEFVKEFSNLAFHGMRAGKNPINVNLDFDLDENAGEVTLVMEDFSRVILNIANNAFDAMRDKQNSSKNGEYLPSLKIKTKRLKNKVLISIQDNGPGIPDGIKDKILHPFFTTKKGTEGTGLGLSITHDIVKAHGGEIKIESEAGDGASFLISLPIS
jgi:signal transduction histidine kinase